MAFVRGLGQWRTAAALHRCIQALCRQLSSPLTPTSTLFSVCYHTDLGLHLPCPPNHIVTPSPFLVHGGSVRVPPENPLHTHFKII